MGNEYELLSGSQTWLAGKPPNYMQVYSWENHLQIVVEVPRHNKMQNGLVSLRSCSKFKNFHHGQSKSVGKICVFPHLPGEGC